MCEIQLTIIINVIRATTPPYFPSFICFVNSLETFFVQLFLGLRASGVKQIIFPVSSYLSVFKKYKFIDLNLLNYRNKTLHMIHCHVLVGNTMLNHFRQESQRDRVTRKSRGGRPGPTKESRACLVCCIQHYCWRSST